MTGCLISGEICSLLSILPVKCRLRDSGLTSPFALLDTEKEMCIRDRARLLLLVDCNHLGRIGNPLEGLVAEIVDKPEVRSVMIDHHPEPEMGLVDEIYSDTSACATCLLYTSRCV